MQAIFVWLIIFLFYFLINKCYLFKDSDKAEATSSTLSFTGKKNVSFYQRNFLPWFLCVHQLFAKKNLN